MLLSNNWTAAGVRGQRAWVLSAVGLPGRTAPPCPTTHLTLQQRTAAGTAEQLLRTQLPSFMPLTSPAGQMFTAKVA